MFPDVARLQVRSITLPRYSQQQVNAALDGVEAWAAEQIASTLADKPAISAEAACLEIMQSVIAELREAFTECI